MSEVKRPARKQVEAPVTGFEESNDLATYNIWHHRRAKGVGAGGPRREGRGTKQKSEYRCHPTLDSGYTRGEGMGCGYCCLYFARGICHHGADCNYLHRVPTADDEIRHCAEPQYDIFGRDRLAETGRTKGVGSYNRDCTTLYAYIGGAATLPAAQLQKLIRENFLEWGPVDDVHVVVAKAIAFVRYRWRSSAEFAKAAMHQQTLTGTDNCAVLDVRWANDDPNPRARVASQRHKEEALVGAYMAAVNNSDPETKRARLQQLQLNATYRPGAAASAYPDTSEQYIQQYSHEYSGWDARAYAEGAGAASGEDVGYDDDDIGLASSGGDAAGRGGAAAVAQEAAVQQYNEAVYAGQRWQHWPAPPGEGDDISRYLRPGDRLAAPRGAALEAAGAGLETGEDAGRRGADAAADEALALIGGYGSASDED